jgi:RNA polymerase sigma-70 factor (ECF subfamily)
MSDEARHRLSFEAVANTVTPQLRRYLERMVGNATVAEDLLQETLLRIARGLAKFRGQSSVRTWAFSIATRVVADHFRRPEVKSRLVDIDDNEALTSEIPDVGDRLVVDEMNSCVREVIDSLPQDYRAALVLHDLEGFTVASTADACGCSLATAKIRIHRARARLKKALQNECSFYRDSEDVLRCDRRGPEPPSAAGHNERVD